MQIRKKSTDILTVLFCFLNKVFMSPDAAVPTINKDQGPQTFVQHHGDPDTDQSPIKDDTKKVSAGHGNQPHGKQADRYGAFNITGSLQRHHHDHINGAPDLQKYFD